MPLLRPFLMFLAVFAWAAYALTPAAAKAGTVLSGLEGMQTVADDQLADMRGKFITPQGVAFFGLDMSTSWQDAQGVTTAARLVFTIDFAGSGGNVRNATPQIFVTWSRREGDKTLDIASPAQSRQGASIAGVAAPVGALDTVRGAVQSQLISGADNSVRNAMSIAVTSDPQDRPDTAGLTPVTGGSSQQFGDGDTLQFLVSNSEVGLLLTNGPFDSTRQGVNTVLNQLAQQVTVNSSFNEIANRMEMTIGIDPAAQANQMNASGAMSAMHGIGF